MLHLLAFASPGSQRTVAELEDQLYGSRLAEIEIRRPVFVTALPRAGTTLLLEILVSLDEFASHSYRYMPFVLCPLLWNRISSLFHRAETEQERAHQDGMMVSLNSPEAFEEMIWMPFWKDHYASDRIHPWFESDPEFFEFMQNHMKKVILLKGTDHSVNRRYVSKNNLNIARIEILACNFSDAFFIVPFREPLQHAASLLRQHNNFLRIHGDDKFARRYMAGIGHFDFGENLRPVDFGGWLDRTSHQNPRALAFWLEYWIAAYECLAGNRAVTLLCYEDLCSETVPVLESLADLLQIRDRAAFLRQATRFKMPSRHPIDIDSEGEEPATRAAALYETMRSKSLSGPVS